MAYTRQGFTQGQVLNASNLTAIEDGIVGAEGMVDALAAVEARREAHELARGCYIDYGWVDGDQVPSSQPFVGVTVTRNGSRVTLNGTCTSSSNYNRIRMSGPIIAKTAAPTAAENDSTYSVPLINGHKYMISTTLVSGAIDLTSGYVPGTWAYKAATTSNYDRNLVAQDRPTGTNIVWFESDGENILLWFFFGKGQVFTNAVYEVNLVDITQLDKRDYGLTKAMSSLAPQEQYTGSDNGHNAGELLVHHGQLYRVTQTIASGESITEGTNVTATTIAAELTRRETIPEKTSAEDWLYSLIFGNNDDWAVAMYDSSSMGITKTGRLFTISGNSTTNSSHYTVNLTGSTHVSRTGNWENKNAALYDDDFITIPGFLKRLTSTTGANFTGLQTCDSILSLDLLAKTGANNDQAHAGLQFGIVFRRYNSTSQQYEYSDGGSSTRERIALMFSNTWGSTQAILTPPLAAGYNIAASAYTKLWENYDQVAIYLTRCNRIVRGTLIISPRIQRYYGITST